MDLKLINVVIPCKNYRETSTFYRDTLGFRVFHEGPGHCFLKAGGAYLAIHPVADDGEASPGIYLDFSVKDWPVVKARLDEAKVTILKEWKCPVGTIHLIADPEGNLIELIEYPQESRKHHFPGG